jgi:hypothetical protein
MYEFILFINVSLFRRKYFLIFQYFLVFCTIKNNSQIELSLYFFFNFFGLTKKSYLA